MSGGKRLFRRKRRWVDHIQDLADAYSEPLFPTEDRVRAIVREELRQHARAAGRALPGRGGR